MRILILGSGGREHALAWALAKSPLATEVLCAPGSDGIATDCRVVPADLSDPEQITALARHERSDLVVVGPEDPLAAGIADRLRDAGVAVFGPSGAAARLEGSKEFANDFMARHGIPTAAHRAFSDPDEADAYLDELAGPVVVKADGLAAGKGVTVCDDAEQAKRAVHEAMRERRFGAAGGRVLIEERLYGEEASFYAIADGQRFVTLPAAQDHKRIGDGDRGENTGGMGAFSPTPVVTPELERDIVERIVRPTFDGMRAEGHPYRGVLYVGLIVCDGEPYVIEYNVRFGDPETQPLLVRLESDLLPVLAAAARGELPEDAMLEFGDPAVCVVMASDGYPRSYPVDLPISGLEAAAELPDAKVFHAGTRRGDGRWYTAGGRVVGVTARGATLRAARDAAYSAVELISWKGEQHRGDIASRAAGT